MPKSNEQCAHPACRCNVGEDGKYCSPYCKDAGDSVEIACNCGHAGCAVAGVESTISAAS